MEQGIMIPEIEATFINFVKITEVDGIDYIVHLLNNYTGKTWVFKIYKSLWEKAMEIRKVVPLEVTVSNLEEEAKKRKEEEDKKIASAYM